MFQIDPTSRVPIYEQLINNVVRLASVGVLKPDDKLPPVRALASQLGINPNTVAKAYRDLEMRGYIYSSVGRGSFIHPDMTADAARKLLILEKFTEACTDAYNSGISYDDLNHIVSNVYRGERKND